MSVSKSLTLDQPDRVTCRDGDSAQSNQRRRLRPESLALVLLALLASTHFLVDTVAGTVNPLWPRLERKLGLADGGIVWIYVAWMVSTSFSQLVFGALADRFSMRWLIWCGPTIAILSLSCLGFVESPLQLGFLFVVGGLGIASFHPEGAAFAGSLLPAARSRMMAVFALSGYLGQAVGPFYSGLMASRLGLPGLAWGITWFGGTMLLLALPLSRLRRRQTPPAADTTPKAVTDPSLSREEHGVHLPRSGSSSLIWLLLAIGALRILPALGVPFALAFLLDEQGAAESVIGAIQSAFMAGLGVGAMGCAAWVRGTHERKVIVWMPLVAAPVLCLMVIAQSWALVALVGLTGLLLGVSMPVYISYGQQLLPQSQRVASSITMGVSWGIGGGLNALAFRIFQASNILPWIFLFFASVAVASSFLCRWLPAVHAPPKTTIDP